MSRTVVWWSAGAASTVAGMLALRKDPSAIFVYTDPGSEHPDNRRFRKDVERWLDVEILVLGSSEYKDTWDVWERTGWLVGQGGARCTVELQCIGNSVQPQVAMRVLGIASNPIHRATASLLPTPTASQPGGTAEGHLERKRGGKMNRRNPTITDLGMLVEQLAAP